MDPPPLAPELFLTGPQVFGHRRPKHGFHVFERFHHVPALAPLGARHGVVKYQRALAPILPGLDPVLEQLSDQVAILAHKRSSEANTNPRS